MIQIGTSFKTNPDATANPLNPIPQEWTLDAYRSLRQADFPVWFMNSLIVTLCVTVRRVFLDSLAGYALARLHFRGRAGPSALFIGIMAWPAVVLLIPTYLVLAQLGIHNTYTGMIIPLLACSRRIHHAAVLSSAFRSWWRSPLGSTAPARSAPSGPWS